MTDINLFAVVGFGIAAAALGSAAVAAGLRRPALPGESATPVRDELRKWRETFYTRRVREACKGGAIEEFAVTKGPFRGRTYVRNPATGQLVRTDNRDAAARKVRK